MRRRRGWLGFGRAAAALLTVLVVVAAGGSDFVAAPFWVEHPMLTAIVSALVVVLLSVSVIDVVLHRRSERRWRILAQGALIELAEAANATWSALSEASGVEGVEALSPQHVRERITSSSAGPEVRALVEDALADSKRREALARAIEGQLADGRAVIGRWAIALTASETYAELFDQHVEMYLRLEGLQYFLVHGYRRSDPRGLRGRPRRAYQAPGGEEHDEWFVNNVITTVSIAATLEDETWDLALRVVSEDWWDRRTEGLAAATRLQRGRRAEP